MTKYTVDSETVALCTDGNLHFLPLEPWQVKEHFDSMTEAAIALFELSRNARVPLSSFSANYGLTLSLISASPDQLSFTL